MDRHGAEDSALLESDCKQRLAARIADRHRREPHVVWSGDEIARLVLEELGAANLGEHSVERLVDTKAALSEAFRLIRLGGRTWRLDS